MSVESRGPVRDLPGAVQFAKTVSESDVYQFAGITGDLHPVHTNADYASRQPVGQRIAHGILIQGLMSTACTKWMESAGIEIVSYGWDRVRFVKPVFFGDTITTAYSPLEPDEAHLPGKHEARADAINQHGEVVGVGTHIFYVTSSAPQRDKE